MPQTYISFRYARQHTCEQKTQGTGWGCAMCACQGLANPQSCITKRGQYKKARQPAAPRTRHGSHLHMLIMDAK